MSPLRPALLPRRVRRERVSTLRRMSDVAAGLQAEENAVVPPVVSRLLHLELELDLPPQLW